MKITTLYYCVIINVSNEWGKQGGFYKQTNGYTNDKQTTNGQTLVLNVKVKIWGAICCQLLPPPSHLLNLPSQINLYKYI